MRAASALAILLTASPAPAHIVSMSTGEARIDGRLLAYELRMPLYEAQHVRDPERMLLDRVQFASGGRLAKRREGRCRADQDTFLCTASYEFESEPETLEVECTLHVVTVPNHVHLLRAWRGERSDQAVFDLSFPRAVIRFRPPTAFESALAEIGGGVGRAVAGWAQVLFLASLVLAARSRRELAALAAMFLAGQALAAMIVPRLQWQPAPRFVEAAAALTIAYLAVEILLLPKAGQRWAVVAVLGLFHGLGLALFLKTTGYSTAYVMTGAALGSTPLILVFAWVFTRATKFAPALRPLQTAASLLLAIGLVWFFLRLRT